MAKEMPLYQETFLTGGDLSASKYRFVKLNSSGQVVPVAAVTDVPIGVLQENAASSASGLPVTVTVVGKTKVEAGAAITTGPGVIGVDSVGRGVNKTIGTDLTHYAGGTALEAVGASGSLFTAYVNCMQPNRCT